MSMIVSVENLSNIERKLTISLPQKDIDAMVQKRLCEIVPKIRIAGFRKGKVPKKLVEKNYQGTVRGEIIEKEVERSYVAALEQEKIRPVGLPRIELAAPKKSVVAENSVVSNAPEQEMAAVATTDVAAGVDSADNVGDYFTYYAFVEIYPEVNIADLSSISVEKYETAVTEDDVASMLEKMRKQDAEWVEVTDAQRTVQQGDKILVDFTTKVHVDASDTPTPVKEEEEKDVKFEIGGGEMWPDFEAPLIGKVVGDEVKFTLRFPETHIKKEVAGKMADFCVRIKQLWESKLPSLDEEFAKKHDVAEGGIEALRVQLRDNMEKNIKRYLADIFHASLCSRLVDLHAEAISVPRAFVQEEIKRERERMMERYKSMFRLKSLPKSLDFPDTHFEKQARHNVLLSMLLGRIAELNNLKVDPEKVRAEIEKRVAGYHDPEGLVKWFYSDEKRVKSVETELLTEETFAFVEQQVKVVPQQISYQEAVAKKVTAAN